MSIIEDESIKIVVALKMARAALGMSQVELAELLSISKITLARVETLETPLKAEIYIRALKVFRELGVDLDVMSSSGVIVQVEPRALQSTLEQFKDDSRRRSDRKK